MENDIKDELFFQEDIINSDGGEIFRNIVSPDKLKSKDTKHFQNVPKMCSYFHNNGYCKFGSSCKYQHRKDGPVNLEYGFKSQKATSSQDARKYKHLKNENGFQNCDEQKPVKQKCRFYRMGDCKKGENCGYLHSDDSISCRMASLSVSLQHQNVPKKLFSSGAKSTKKKAPLCHYFKKGLCYNGDSCKFYHQYKSDMKDSGSFSSSSRGKYIDSSPNTNVSNANSISVTENSTTKRSVTVFNRTLNTYDLSSLTADAIAQLRSTEMNQLKKRFPHSEVVIEDQTFSVLFEPSDPDWAFDLNKLQLEVDFPADYPKEKCKITVLQSTENIPYLLIKYLNKTISDWIDKKVEENRACNKTELIFRPFLKWFDKNLEDLFITGLRKVKQDLKAQEDGIEFVPSENLFSSPQKNNSESSLQQESSAAECIKEDSMDNTLQLEEQNTVPCNNISIQRNQDNKSHYYSSNNGMKIIFTGLEFVEGAAAFLCTKISATLQCSRCKTHFNMKSVPKKNNSQVCVKCSKNVGFTFEPSTVHQFSNVLGTLHLLDCVAVDINLVECHFLVDCLNCSKQVPVDGIHYGQKHKMWCTFCSERMLVSIGSVKFQTLRSTSVSVAKYPPAKKVEKKGKDPVVKEGEPLPNFGACKHYKKSFRWLRFPCCGRLYPCDECHDEKESDHEMKYASRMLCGFCAKEQPYSREKPCILCSQSLTRKSGSHWEGGKGCRNRIQMSREDKQKYSGVSKTVSKKAQMNKPSKKH